MCGLFLWGSSWWIVPLLMCVGFLILMFRMASIGGGCRWMAMGGDAGMRKHEGAATRE